MKGLMRISVCFLIALLAIVSIGGNISANAAATGSSAECMVLMDVKTNRVIYKKNAALKRPMASTTKIMTAIAVIENTADLNKIVKIPDSAVGVEGSSIYLEKGEELSLLDLLYGLMLQSGNDCAEALAVLTSGSKEKFAGLMNASARKIGALNSNFVTPHGLHHAEHYTTAYDLALISSYALKNPVFAKIVSTKKHTTAWKGRDYKRVIINKNKLLSSFEGADGVKTGYTKKAGRCFVSSATRDGRRCVCAVLNCGPMFEECSSLMSRYFKEYENTEAVKKYDKLCDVPVKGAKNKTVAAGAGEDLLLALNAAEKENLRVETEYFKGLKAPVKAGTVVGKILIYVQNNLLFEEKLYTIEDAESKDLFDLLKDLADEWTA